MTVTFKTLKPLLAGLATAAALLIGARSAAAGPGAEPLPPPNTPDAKFAAAASAANVKELQASGAAQVKALSDDVKKFARKMAEDHAKANQELSVLLVKRGMKCANGAEAETLKALQELRKLTGAEFDKRYMAMMVQDHRACLHLYEAEAKDGEDPELKELAEKRLPMLKEHLKLAEDTAAKVGAKGEEKPKEPTSREGPTTREGKAP
jgi:putative membrane protein